MPHIQVRIGRDRVYDSQTAELYALFSPWLMRDAGFEEGKHKRAGNGQFSSSGGGGKVTPTEKKFTSMGVTGEHKINLKNKKLTATKHGISVNEYIQTKHGGDKQKALAVLNYFHKKGDIEFDHPGGAAGEAAAPAKVEPKAEEKHPAPGMKPQASSLHSKEAPAKPDSAVTPAWVASNHKNFIKNGGTESQKNNFEEHVALSAKNHGLNPDYAHNKVLAIANGTALSTNFPKHPAAQQSAYMSEAGKQVAAQMQAHAAAKAQEQASFGGADYVKPKSYTMGHGEYLKNSSEHVQPNKDEARALKNYSSYFHAPLNEALRKGDHLNIHQKEASDNLDKFIDNSPINKDTTLFRGVKPVVIQALSKLKPGDTYSEPAFTSTSYNQSTATNFGHGNHLMVIRAKKGAKGAHMGEHTHHESENEVVLGRNTPLKFVGRSKEGHYVFDHT